MPHIVTNGPFYLESWQLDESMVLVHNPDYQGRFTGNTQHVELALVPPNEWPRVLEMYEADELDVVLRPWHLPPQDDIVPTSGPDPGPAGAAMPDIHHPSWTLIAELQLRS